MSSPFVGEIRMFAGNFPPLGWAQCDGQILAIAQNDVVFNLIGTTYGGDGFSTFALPDLRGRFPVHQGTGPGLSPRVIGEAGGRESITQQPIKIPGAPTGPVQASVGFAPQLQTMSPFSALNFIISLFGIFPSQT
jgi:microcystin-dependent protein